ncbi:hypothetical protein CRT38_00265 [Anaplasma phagocytophilum str. CRT38]|uniref:Uncharacterized protein n=1 Tax=Anaplasma phagocytophilum str. CRT38 TaxID=1269275 RepID=S6GB76_ANAPH|nr:hypothetical protein CRT38_00265 [Anaplasma phagocytophilum str. CRT38]
MNTYGRGSSTVGDVACVLCTYEVVCMCSSQYPTDSFVTVILDQSQQKALGARLILLWVVLLH